MRSIQNLRNYSLIGAAVVLVAGVTGGFFLSGRMLKPVDRVSAVAGSISQSNLKERLRYRGPNDEIKRLADTFDTMLERLDNSFEAQKQFIQDASHELRTPIAIAQTNIEVIEMDGDATATDYHHVFEVIKLSLDRMTAVNDGLLMLSEGAPPKARWQKVDLPAFIAEVAAETAAKARALDIKLETQPVESGLTLDGDPVRLKQAVINLVHNGIKYNRPGGTVVLSAHREDDLIAIAVKDTGIGISCEDIPHVFDRFYRVDKSRSRAAGGSGLGLAIVKKIAEDHGGEVRVTSSPDVGSMFRLVLPTRNAASG